MSSIYLILLILYFHILLEFEEISSTGITIVLLLIGYKFFISSIFCAELINAASMLVLPKGLMLSIFAINSCRLSFVIVVLSIILYIFAYKLTK